MTLFCKCTTFSVILRLNSLNWRLTSRTPQISVFLSVALKLTIFQHVHRQRQMMWLLQPTGRSSDTWKQPAMCGSARNFCMVGTRGVTDARSCPVVSFWGTQGSSAEELHHTSICHHRSFDCKCVGTFCQHPTPLSCWSVVSGHSYSGSESGGQINSLSPMGRASLTVHRATRPQWPWRPWAEQKPSDQMFLLLIKRTISWEICIQYK